PVLLHDAHAVRPNLLHDRYVGGRDAVDGVELVEEVAEVARAEQELERRVRLPGLVDRDRPLRQDRLRPRELPPRRRELPLVHAEPALRLLEPPAGLVVGLDRLLQLLIERLN